MEPTYVFYSKLPLDENNIFSANLAENNEIEEVKLKNLKITTSADKQLTKK